MTVFFTSDNHMDHYNVLFYCGRPFFNLAHMQKEIVKRWNAVISNEDTIYVLGDFCFNFKTNKHVVPKLRGKKILVIGNHDAGFPGSSNKKAFLKFEKQYIDAGWDSVVVSDKVWSHRLQDYLYLNHFPPTIDVNYNPLKYNQFRPRDEGNYMLCGHIHNSWLKKGKCINVGVDVFNFTPVKLHDIEELFISGKENLDAPQELRRKAFRLYHKLYRRFFRRRSIKPVQ